ncbi:hypothetical protein TTHERM_00661480 (macronuclear) [Tetrahymena thermophila SB210]|uniref:Uncharacterized protein n=1 Tax=Tetrahymena thermophila (strain SB210) TaxID=312017 RepID=I7M2C9_TETTS|nr:hypothetical protein TTHERM_00661480 [Tetrahymena thermophila SB210]EAR99867.2 hypothetical protein TTHERM_00661480 [Tetrahymena thermophila SB210]|eukprot:XP_001020112.2 hypothetical protein TTHERM_00661480 [Tetrahymena thermophila SB210]
MTSKQKNQNSRQENILGKTEQLDKELLRLFDQINATLSGQINYLNEYKQIFKNYRNTIQEGTLKNINAISDKVCKLVEDTIQKQVYSKIENNWRVKIQQQHEKCFQEIVSSLQNTFSQIDELAKQNNHYTSLNIISIRSLYDNQLSQSKLQLRNINEDNLIRLQNQIDDHFKKYVSLYQKAEQIQALADSESAKYKNEAQQKNKQQEKQGENQTSSTQGAISTNDDDDDVGFSKKTEKKESKNNDAANQSGLLSKIKNIFKKEDSRASQVNLEGVSNDFRYCPIKKQWIFEGQEENSVLDEPPPIIPVNQGAANAQQSDQNNSVAADNSVSNLGSGAQTPSQAYDPKQALTRPVNYRNARDLKAKAKEKEKQKPRPAAFNFMQQQKVEENMSNYDSTANNFDSTEQNIQNIESNNQLSSDANLGLQFNNQEVSQVNISEILESLNSQIQFIIKSLPDQIAKETEFIDFEEIESRIQEQASLNAEKIFKQLKEEIFKQNKLNTKIIRRMQNSYEEQIRQLTHDYMDLMDQSIAQERHLIEDETLNSTIDSSVIEFCSKQSEKIKQLQTELMKKQCMMGKQDNKNMEVIKNMVDKINQLENKLLKYTDMELENENLQKINQQLQKLSKQSQEQAAKVFGIKHQNMQSISTINQQLAEQIHSRQQLIDTLHQEITQKNRAIHELQAKNTNLQNISYEKEERITELQNILEEKELEINDLNKKESLLNEDIMRLKDTLVAIQDELIAKKQEISHHINDLTQLQEKNENYEQIEQNMNEELVNLQLEYNNYREEVEEKIEKLTLEIKEINLQKDELQEQLDQIQTQKQSLSEERDVLIQEKEDLIQNNQTLIQEKENLQVEIESLQTSMEQQKDAFDKEIDAFEEIVLQIIEKGSSGDQDHHASLQQPKLTSLIEILNKKMVEVQSQKEHLEQEMKYLNQDIENEKMTVEQLYQECDNLAEEKNIMAQNYDNALAEKKQVCELLEEKTQQLRELQEKEQNKENDFQHFENQIKEKEAQILELENKLQEINKTTEEVNSELKEKIDVLHEKEETIKILKESLDNYNIKYNTKVSELQEIHDYISQMQNDIKQKEAQIEESNQLNQQLSNQYQELQIQNENLIYQNQNNFNQVDLLSKQIQEQNQLIEDLNLEKNTLSTTLFSNQELINSYKLKLEELQQAFEFNNTTISEYEKQIAELNSTVSQLNLLCQQKDSELQNYKLYEEKISNHQLIDKEEYDRKEKELREKIENLSKEIYELNRQNDEQTNEFANKIITLESLNTDLNDQMEQIRSEKDKQIQLVKEKYQQLESEYRGQIEELQSQLKWEKQINEDSDLHSNKKLEENYEFNENSAEGQVRSGNLGSQNNQDSRQELDSYKERVNILEVQIIKLKNDLQTSQNTNTVIERQIKGLHSTNENFAKEIDSLLIKLDNEQKKYIALQKETEEQIESITDEKRHLKMNFDELLEKMNESENFERLNQLQKEIDSLKIQNEQLQKQLSLPQVGSQIERQSSIQIQNQGQVVQKSEQNVDKPAKKSGSEEIHEINLVNDILRSPISQKPDNQPSSQVSSQTLIDKDQKKGGFFNTLAGIFLTEKDRQMLGQQPQKQ